MTEPWFSGWSDETVGSRAHARVKVADLFNQQMQQWNVELLEKLFQPQQVGAILGGSLKLNNLISDKLIWHKSKGGRYTVKEGYQYLVTQRREMVANSNSSLWMRIWQWKGVIPKIKLFFWRLINGALMLAQNMHKRLHNFSPACQRCHAENEYETHCFFFCSTSRVVWFGTDLGLRIYELPLNITNAIQWCIQGLSEEGIKLFSYTMWELWKARNGTVLQNKKFSTVEVLRKIRCWTQQNGFGAQSSNLNSNAQDHGVRYSIQPGGFQIIIDGSWDPTNRAGCAHIIYRGRELWRFGISNHILHDPFHAEAMALKEALQHASNLGVSEQIEVFSDSLYLVKIMKEEDTEDAPSWRTIQDVKEAISFSGQFSNRIWYTHVNREAVGQAHFMANVARRGAVVYQGGKRLWSEHDCNLLENLDARFFQKITEAPP